MKSSFSFILGLIVILLIAGAAYTFFGKKTAEAPTVNTNTLINNSTSTADYTPEVSTSTGSAGNSATEIINNETPVSNN